VEARLKGTQPHGARLNEIGVAIFGVRDDKIAWARLYLEEIETNGGDIDAAVQRMAGREAG
jgi:hypothetical protein